MTEPRHKAGMQYGSFNGTAAGTSGGVTLTIADPGAGKANYLVGHQVSGDVAALVTVESPAATIIWRKRYSTGFEDSEIFDPPLQGAESEALIVKISASTANSAANAQGYIGRRLA